VGRLLDDAQIAAFDRDGVLAIEGFVGPDALAELRQRADDIVDAWEPTAAATVFTTEDQQRRSNDEFLSSGGRIWCFLEEGAVDGEGHLTRDKSLAVNKIGHAQHDLDDVFERFSYTDDLAGVASDIGLSDAVALQSMYIFKQPGIGGEVSCHQDATFLYTDPLSVTGFWFAVEDATLDNGCLWAAPGRHRDPLRRQFRRRGDNDAGTEFVDLDPTPLPAAPDDLVPLEVPAGTLVVLDGRLPHWSDVNRSPKSRHAYTLHCISAGADYPDWNWLQRGDDMPLRRLDRSDR